MIWNCSSVASTLCTSASTRRSLWPQNQAVFTVAPMASTLSSTAKKTMIYGNPQCLEMPLWGGVDVTVDASYKIGEGLLTVLGEVTADAAVTVKNGFVVVSGKSA